ncbi:MAG TPA: putative lipid II flippase FtsW [Burkholderiales bacterium]|nr:putative lipid II flippase FtsW [Burkholderiales bacterium]
MSTTQRLVYSSGGQTGKPAPEFDPVLLACVFALLALGLVMVYSASVAIAEKNAQGAIAHYLARHSIALALGLAGALVVFQFPLRFWQRVAPWIFVGGTLLLVLVLVPGIGREVNGSQRWLPLHFFNLQPSELMKLAVVLYAADYTVRKAAYMDSIVKSFLPMLMVMLLTGALLLQEPDFGAFAVITVIGLTILFLGGMNWKLFAGMFALLAGGFVALVMSSPYRMQRITAFLNPWDDPLGKGYQLSHSLIAFGRGEWFGVGLGASIEKQFYLPEAHTDFLLAVIAEELGFIGVVVVIALLVAVTLRAFAIGRTAATLEREFAALSAQGIGVWIGVQAIINMGVNMGLLPTKGLTLPLVSFGGSALLANCLALAILLRVDWENRQLMKGFSV